MSSLTRLLAIRPVAPLNSAAVCRTLSVGGYRAVSSTTKKESGPVDAAKSTLKKADRIISNAAVKGIDTGEAAAHKIKDTVGKTAGEASKKSGELKGKAEVAGKTKGKAQETVGQAKGKVKEEFKS